MSIPLDVVKCSLNGTLLTEEDFSIGFWLEGGAPQTVTAAQTWATILAGYFDQYLDSALLPALGVGDEYTDFTVYSYPGGGPNALVSASAPIASGSGTGLANLPLQTSLVVSTRSDFIGRRARGRMYIPMTGLALQTTSQWQLSEVQGIVDAFDSFFTNIKSNSTLGTPVIVSQVGPGSTVEITALRADTKPDIQRRRAERVAALGTATAVV